MLYIRKSQDIKFNSISFNSYINKLIAFFKEEGDFSFINKQFNERNQKVRFHSLINSANQHGFFNESDLFKYIVTSLILGKNFDISSKHKMLMDLLDDDKLSPDDKFNIIYAYIKETKPERHTLRRWV